MKKGRFLNDFEEPPRLLGIIQRYRKYPYAELGIRGFSTVEPISASEYSGAISCSTGVESLHRVHRRILLTTAKAGWLLGNQRVQWAASACRFSE